MALIRKCSQPQIVNVKWGEQANAFTDDGLQFGRSRIDPLKRVCRRQPRIVGNSEVIWTPSAQVNSRKKWLALRKAITVKEKDAQMQKRITRDLTKFLPN